VETTARTENPRPRCNIFILLITKAILWSLNNLDQVNAFMGLNLESNADKGTVTNKVGSMTIKRYDVIIQNEEGMFQITETEFYKRYSAQLECEVTMTFVDAGILLSKGDVMARKAWPNGEFVFKFSPASHGMEIMNYQISKDGVKLPLREFIMFRDSIGATLPYSTCPEDMIADDWYRVDVNTIKGI
jgi:hypothetical protein